MGQRWRHPHGRHQPTSRHRNGFRAQLIQLHVVNIRTQDALPGAQFRRSRPPVPLLLLRSPYNPRMVRSSGRAGRHATRQQYRRRFVLALTLLALLAVSCSPMLALAACTHQSTVACPHCNHPAQAVDTSSACCAPAAAVATVPTVQATIVVAAGETGPCHSLFVSTWQQASLRALRLHGEVPPQPRLVSPPLRT